MDLITRLRDEMKTRHGYDKIFQKIWGASDADSCGPHCQDITKCVNIEPRRASWTIHPHIPPNSSRGSAFLWLICTLYRHGDSQQHATRSQVYLNLSQSVHPGAWKETTGLDIQGFLRQLLGNDCGIFMLMYALYTVLDAPSDFTVMDVPSLPKCWCVMLMENSDLGSHGKMFAHWTDNSKALLQPVFHLKKRKMDDITETEEQQQQQPAAQPQQVIVVKDVEMTMEVDKDEARVISECRQAAAWVFRKPALVCRQAGVALCPHNGRRGSGRGCAAVPETLV
ncbi:uncharacterized protein LOC110972427 isoform X1 [Acanthochromis polyacanthus]|uniref:uncharacterized protein LOC110972427 isoform X1 n=1 Tax=Acanthochromis polyacanthus TaxID=80966 RepID=UPI0022341ED2|nr:uncharacterized protein LOC110972427 isoform X1 [Acanthochromis polyacanthus]